jgi:hypothetical protein
MNLIGLLAEPWMGIGVRAGWPKATPRSLDAAWRLSSRMVGLMFLAIRDISQEAIGV